MPWYHESEKKKLVHTSESPWKHTTPAPVAYNWMVQLD
jgi:hypothetical protein